MILHERCRSITYHEPGGPRVLSTGQVRCTVTYRKIVYKLAMAQLMGILKPRHFSRFICLHHWLFSNFLFYVSCEPCQSVRTKSITNRLFCDMLRLRKQPYNISATKLDEETMQNYRNAKEKDKFRPDIITYTMRKS